ncbi:DUF1783-domain-containing protein [Punctularia strigosozonata HHB-11173 SS5]|uniref:DUF1783-domain-containing protein n=1 Tax=Punctularia strigosozonata (strain HHB-11173) TaxID=741275 RepID=UPI0004417429|nr:DUF1783-domain-containing protein [Punctularia strigosozonata HHB-11173 SS5]EIN07027.1 DUF1783-domain-containing protein [Punctularia strigosozonata HHB-11173 SS5]
MNAATKISRILPKRTWARSTPPSRTYATELPRPPPSDLPPAQTFSQPSKPRAYYDRPALKRDLPPFERKWPTVLALGVAGVTGWIVFYIFAANQEKLSSSVVRQILDNIRDSPELKEVLGDAIRPEPAWYLNGHPWIAGSVSNMQGHADVSFRVKGHKGAGTLYFTSIRKAKGEPFTVLRFRVITDDGTIVNIPLSSLS